MQYGTVKVGRWHYPARQLNPDTVERTEKRDGSGAWEETNPALFTPIGQGDPAVEKVALAMDAEWAANEGHAKDLEVVPPMFDDFVEIKDAASVVAVEPEPEPKPAKKIGGGRKSTWMVGGECPNGHELTADTETEKGTLYVMPSGRKQCRICRGGYRSNDSK